VARFSDVLRRVARPIDHLSLPILIVASPFFLFPSPTRAFTLLLIPGLLLNARFAGREFMPRTPLDGALFLLLTMVVVSIWATSDLVFSLSKIVGVIYSIVIFYSVLRWLKEPREVWLGCNLFSMAGAGLACLSWIGTNWSGKFQSLQGVTSRLPRLMDGLPGAEAGFHPNAVAGALVLFLPLQFVLALDGPTWKSSTLGLPSWCRARYLLGSVRFFPTIATSATLIVTQCRGAWIGVSIALIVLLAGYKRNLRRWIVIVGLSGMVGALGLMARESRSIPASQETVSVGLSVAGRMEVWSRGIYAVQDFPFTGLGMNMFRRVMPDVYPSFLIPPDYDVGHAHNHLLQAALDLGVPGLIGYLALWFEVGYLLLFSHRRTKRNWLKSAARGIGSGLMAYFIFAMADGFPLGARVGILLWLPLALAVAIFLVVYEETKIPE
jgi:hypothetical protein